MILKRNLAGFHVKQSMWTPSYKTKITCVLASSKIVIIILLIHEDRIYCKSPLVAYLTCSIDTSRLLCHTSVTHRGFFLDHIHSCHIQGGWASRPTHLSLVQFWGFSQKVQADHWPKGVVTADQTIIIGRQKGAPTSLLPEKRQDLLLSSLI